MSNSSSRSISHFNKTKQLILKTAVIILITVAVLVLFRPDGVFSQSEPVIILPLGDSVTQGDTTYNSYRRPLWQLLQNGGYSVDFVGSLVNNAGGPPPNPDFDTDHEGHARWRADQLVDRGLATWLESYTPDIVLLHTGHNDLTRTNRNDVVVQGTLDDVAEIITVLRADNPNVTVLLAQLIPSCQAILGANIVTYNDRLPAFVATQTTAASPIILVDQFSGFDAQTDTHDCVHPNVAGEQKVAQNWFDALVPLLGNSTPVPTATETVAPTATATNTPGPTATVTNTAVPPTVTPTDEPTVPPTATNTPLPPTETAVPGTCSGNTILFVGRSNPLPSDDQSLVDHLVGLGHSVVVLDERSISTADADGKDLILISDSVNSRRISTIFRDVSTPVMTWEAGLYDDMQMTASSNADLGFFTDQTQLTITHSTHQLADGLSGSITILDTGDYLFWGEPSSNAVEIAESDDGSHPVIFAYENGAEMVGLTAPARRLGFFNGNGESYSTAGWQLFDAAILWSLGCN